MKTFALTAIAVAASAIASPSLAQTTVNFDQSTDSASYASQGLVLNGFTITNNTFGGAVNIPSTPNYANVDATGSFITFVDPTTGVATTSNGFGLTVPGLNLGGGYYAGGTLTFLDVNGGVLGTQSFASVGPNEQLSSRSYANAFQGIARVNFTRIENASGPALFPIDDVTFSLNAGAVPEPATWAMFILGFGAVGGVMRRKVRNSEVRFAA